MLDIPHIDLPPLCHADGTVRLPGSKSISNRVLLLAGLCEGQTRIHDLLDSDDTRVMLDALRALGCGVDAPAPGTVTIEGLGGRLPRRQADLFLGNAGTAMRPLTAALAVLAARDADLVPADPPRFTLSGVPRMHERPIGDLVQALRALGCMVEELGTPGYPPLRLLGGELRTGAAAAPIRVRGDVSSQFLTALLMALPLAAAEAAVTIEVDGELISKPYVEITLNLLARFGIVVQRQGWARFTIPAGSRYVSPGDIHVEGDASSASYFIALGALAADDGRCVRIEGVGLASIQGDIRFVEAARAMGAQVDGGPNHLEVRRGPPGQGWPLRALDLDCNHIPDAAMTLAVMALYADGPSTLRNIASWRVKETDRITAMATELRKLGAQIEEGADFLRITPPGAWLAASVHTYDDHRMAMCLALAAFNPVAGAHPVPVRIQEPRCVGKTFPDFFETLFGVVQTEPRHVPVITVDGPTASGKGTLADELARRLGYAHLDSGALYRATALLALRHGVSLDDEAGLASLAGQLPLRFDGQRIWIDGSDETEALREEAVGRAASRLSAWPAVRNALFQRQLAFRCVPGLVADGRDMGTVVFPDAALKVFLTASVDRRAERRYKQLISKGFSANMTTLRADLEARDLQDTSRSAAPLKPARDALLLDNSGLGIDESVQQVLDWWQQRSEFAAPGR